jgi:OOP family OmpA-OmpF porin
LLAALLVTAGPAGAAPVGAYVGAALGSTSMDLSAADTERGLTDAGFPNRSSVDGDSDTGYRLFAGYRFNGWLGAELSYVHLGKGRIRSTTLTTPAASIDTEIKAYGVNLGLAAGYPVTDRVDLYAKLGVFFWDAKASATATNSAGSADTSSDDSGSDVSYGLGASVRVSDNFALRADWDRYNVGDNADTDLFSVGAELLF